MICLIYTQKFDQFILNYFKRMPKSIHRFTFELNELDSDFDLEIIFNIFLKNNPKLSNVTCIAINTGYTNRIIKNKNALKILKPAVVYTDILWDSHLKPIINNQKLYELTYKKIINDGVCVFDNTYAYSIFELIEKLNRIGRET